MTKPRNPSRYRQIRLALSLGSKQTTYTLVLRTVTGNDVFDRRLQMGVLERPLDPEDVLDTLGLLEAAVYDLRRRLGAPSPAQRPGAPGGGGGRAGHTPSSAADTVPLSVVRDDH